MSWQLCQCLVNITQALVYSAADCGFESWSWNLCPWTRHLNLTASRKVGKVVHSALAARLLVDDTQVIHVYMHKYNTIIEIFWDTWWQQTYQVSLFSYHDTKTQHNWGKQPTTHEPFQVFNKQTTSLLK